MAALEGLGRLAIPVVLGVIFVVSLGRRVVNNTSVAVLVVSVGCVRIIGIVVLTISHFPR